MPQLRQNMATKEWVIIASERAKRPEQFVQAAHSSITERPVYDASCPFCPGNEELELEVLRFPQEGAWQLRAVQNKYPALQREGERKRVFDGVRREISGVGYHEVLVESPLHNTCPALESPEQLTLMLKAFQQRGWEIAKDRRVQHIIYFKNHGLRAGTSLVHPHTQLIGLPVVPYSVRTRTEEARRYFDDTGNCVFCEMLEHELANGQRIVAQNDKFVAFIPYAAFSPFHLWILPRAHEADFLRVLAEELSALGSLLRTVLRKLYIGLRDPDYNYIIRSVPVRDPGDEYLHWYLSIVPRLNRTAGFEMGSGMFINTALPEESAAFLRAVEVD